jgi:hypothetical protein
MSALSGKGTLEWAGSGFGRENLCESEGELRVVGWRVAMVLCLREGVGQRRGEEGLCTV